MRRRWLGPCGSAQCRRRWWVISIVMGVLLVGGSCTALVVDSVVCGSRGDCSVDPTDPVNFNQVRVFNDTSVPVRVAVCEDRPCKYGIDDGTVRSDRSLGTEVSWGEVGAHVRLGDRGAYHCLWFPNSKKLDHEIVLDASAATSC